jgi:uncharacterized repeat protein (TIGR01451 family)
MEKAVPTTYRQITTAGGSITRWREALYHSAYEKLVLTACLLVAVLLSPATAWAQCNQSNLLNYSTAATGSRKTSTETISNTSFTYSGYTTTSPTVRTFGVQTIANLSGTSLVWQEDNQNVPLPNQASITLTFTRPVDNLTLRLQDVDTDAAAYFRDVLRLDGYPTASGGSPAALTASNFTLGTKNTFAGAGTNTVRGTAAAAAGDATASVTVVFSTPVQRLVLTYSNDYAYTANVSRMQTIGINSIAWCAQADVQTSLTGPTRAQAGSTVAYTATTRNLTGDQVTTVRPTVQLPTNLTNVTGGTYVANTGVLTLPVISNLASSASVAQAISYTMPAAVAVTATASFTSTANDPVAANNTSAITTAQNRTPVASNVTNAPAILSSTTSQTNLLPFNASDPDATTGNTTITSFTILSLPTAAQGTLYVNGTAATLNQVITVPTSATAAAPGYQLAFVPNGTFAGSASFTYKATDDTNTSSNTATYFVPVTAGADLVTTVNGSTTGVEGQAKTNTVTTTNNGPAAATNVVPTLTLSHKPPFSTVSVTNGSYDPATGIVTFNAIPSLASGASSLNTVTLTVQAAPASFTLTGASTSSTADPTPANNNGTTAAANLTVTVAPIGPAGVASACATPGYDGSATLTTNPNTYYPAANQLLLPGSTTFVVGAATGSVLTPIVAGDLLLVMQMQGAEIDATNTDSYGDGVAGGFASNVLNNTNFTAGRYEYVVAAGPVPVGGGTVTITTGLKNGYDNASATSTMGQRRFQVVRIPQYKDLTVSGIIMPKDWDGSTGGVLVLDVTGQLTFASGAKIDATGKGFRGGAGQQLTGTTGLSGTDYRAAAPASAGTMVGAHAMKGEGTAGTPRYVNTGTALLDTGIDGYPNGSAGRGAPGNAGGGGTDGSPTPAGTGNNMNSGGGGGGNGSRGGRGGNAWSSNAAVGGETGGSFNPPSSSRLIMGGGGGAGVNNDGSGGGPTPGYASSGAAGGGIVLVRAGSVGGLGTILANGAAASNAVVQDGSGGGGAGGSVLVTVNNTATLSRLTLAANGGSGGSNSATSAHGPGGGGGGGIVLTNAAPASVSVAGGASGATAGGVPYGASAGGGGIANSQISNSIAGSTAGISCSVDVTATLTAPAQTTAAQTVSVAAVFANNGGVAANGVTRIVTLSSGSNASGNVVTNVVAPGSTSISTDALTGDVTITYPSASPLAAGASSQFNISYTAPGTASVVATATAGTTPGEPVTSNNSSSATTAITGFADVVGVIFGLETSTVGRPSGTYGVLFANNGPAAALNVTRTVTLPPGSTLTASQLSALTAQGATFDSNTLTIDFGTIGTWNSRDVSVFRVAYTASNTSGSTAIVSHITTTSQQDAAGGTGAPTAPDTFSFAITNNAAADVATDGITVSAPAVAPGQQASFTFNFRNFGPSDAINASRSAQLTPGLSIVSITGGGSYDALTGLVTYPPLATLASGSTAPSTITFVAPAIGPVSSVASISNGSGAVSLGIFGNNEATASIAVTPLADVAAAISGPASSLVGNMVTYKLTATNSGPSPATDVVQTVQLPAGLAANGVFLSNQGTYNAGTGLATFPPVAVLASGSSSSNTVSFPMPATGFTATAGVGTATAEGGATANNSATAATAPVAVAAADPQANVYNNLRISGRNVAPGTPVTFTVVTGNNGPSPAQNVVQQLSLPAGLSIPGGSISGGGTYNATTGVVTFPALASLASGSSVTNTVTLTAPAAGPIAALASVTATTADPVPADNLMMRNVDITSVTDVTTTLIGPAVASTTEVVRFEVSTRNNGAAPATQVVQTVSIPAGFAPTEVTTTGGGVYDPATGIITWPAVDLLAVGEGRTYTYSYVAPAFRSTDASNRRVVLSQAAVTSSTPEGSVANNTAQVATLIKWTSDVSVAISGPSLDVVGNPVVFTVSTTNNGPAPAAVVNTSVRIATGLNVVASGGGVYDITTGIVTFPTITNQAVGATGVVTNTITVISPSNPLVGASAAADVPAATNDINLTNNAVTTYLLVAPITTAQTDFQTTIVADRTSQQAGQPVVLTVTATSANSSGTTADMQVQVSLPSGLSGVLVSGGGTYDAASGAVTFPRATAQPANTPLSYTITVSSPLSDPLVATASVAGNVSDPTPANNSQVVRVSIVPVADVVATVSGPATMLPGALATYTVVTRNNGPSPASAVTQTVQLPTGLSGVVISGGGSYDAASGLVSFPAIATQAVGAAGASTNTIAFVFPTTASTVTATVRTTTTEPTGAPANNRASLTTTLTNQVPLANTVANILQTPEGNTAGPLTLTALNGLDADGSVASFTIATLPAAAAGVLRLNGAAVTVGQIISSSEAARLSFDPAATFVGNASFTYSATDNQGATSALTSYTIAVGQDNAARYTSMPLKGGANQYQNGDVIANVFDDNGGAYNATAVVTDNGVRTATVGAGSTLPAGLELDPATGQVRVLDRTLLVAGTYPIAITTVDANGGVTTQVVELRIGSEPLAVHLTRFEAAAAEADARLSWTTAQEVDNAGFFVERSTDGHRFEQLDFVAGAGTSAQPQRYQYLDAGVGQQHPGTVYYRLRQTELNGSVTYSVVRALTFAPAAPGLFPNPAWSYTTLNLSMLPEGNYDVVLLDMSGRPVQAYVLAGGRTHELALDQLPGGAYVVVVRNGSQQLVYHLLKQ